MFVFIVANKDATKSIIHLGPIFVFSCQTYILGPIDFRTHNCIIYVFLQIIWATSFQVNHCDEIHIYRKLWKIQTWEIMEEPCAVLWVFWQWDWKRLWGKVRLWIYIYCCVYTEINIRSVKNVLYIGKLKFAPFALVVRGRI